MTIAEIKERLSILTVLAHYGHRPAGKHPGGRPMICCPFHDDKTPSMQVYEKTGTVYCFSSNCKTHGKSIDVIDFIMHKENITKHQALTKATEMVGPAAENLLAKTEVLTRFFRFCENSLHTTRPAKAYLESRGLRQSSATMWGIETGFNSGRFHHKEEAGSPLIQSSLHYGLLSKGAKDGYRVFGSGSLVFPLKNAEGEITGLYFRSIEEDPQAKHLYLRERQGLYPAYPDPQTRILILTESVIDAASLLLHLPDTYQVLALYGTNGFTQEHRQAISRLQELQEVILFLDGDAAGRKAVELHSLTLTELLTGTVISCVDTPENEDINSLVQGHDPKVLLHLVEHRRPLTFSIEKKEAASLLETGNPNDLSYQGTAARYAIKGGIKGGLESLKVSLQIVAGSQDYRSKTDLYEYKQIRSLCEAAATRLGVRTDALEEDLTTLAGLLEHYREHAETRETPAPEPVNPQVSSRCMEFLRRENLLPSINELIGKTGVVGEENNRLLLFVIASSYAMPDTLHALVQGSSGSGKTHLLLQIARLMPQENTLTLTRVTESSFYNYGEEDLKNKLLCMEDLDGMKEEAFLAFRELQSRGMLSSSTSIKDQQGNIKAAVKIVKGPVASLSATTKGEIYEDNMSRCFLVAVDESSEQTQRIITYQNEMSAGLIERAGQKQAAAFLQQCVRMLRPYEVINPYAHRIHLPPQAHKIRRLNELYQVFVRQVTLINQYQREKDEKGRLLSRKEDLQTACRILFDSIVLKVDELDGSLRLFYENLKTYVLAKGKDYEFTRREIREALKVSKTQQHSYMSRLQELEYIRQSGGYINRGLHYKVVYWDSYTALRTRIKQHLESQLEQIA